MFAFIIPSGNKGLLLTKDMKPARRFGHYVNTAKFQELQMHLNAGVN